tara:strand:- start:1163 stop:1762 length:600 start_codon:yes stop_codon:yes gene_type:complete
MYFTNNRSITNSQNNNRQLKLMKFTYNHPQPNIIINNSTPITIKKKDSDKPDMSWGKPYWYFFHTLAEKIKEDKFDEYKKDLIDIIIKLCHNLPCPECSRHASEYLKKNDFRKINTKYELKLMLYTFHNTINKRKGYKEFTLDELNTKYSSANTKEVIVNFMKYCPYRNGKLSMNEIDKTNIANLTREWIRENINIFLD